MIENRLAGTNSPWAYIWEGLLSERYLRLRLGELIFGRAYLFFLFFFGGGWGGLLSEFYGISCCKKWKTFFSLHDIIAKFRSQENRKCMRRVRGLQFKCHRGKIFFFDHGDQFSF